MQDSVFNLRVKTYDADSTQPTGIFYQNFDVVFINPCLSTTVNFAPAVADMVAFVNTGPEVQTVLATDSSSTAYGNGDGVTLCGARTYTITTATIPPTLSLDPGT